MSQQIRVRTMRAFLDVLDPVLREAPRAHQLILALVALAWPSFQLPLPLLTLLDVLLGLLELLSLILLTVELCKVERTIKDSLDLLVDARGPRIEVFDAFRVDQRSVRLLLASEELLGFGSRLCRITIKADWLLGIYYVAHWRLRC